MTLSVSFLDLAKKGLSRGVVQFMKKKKKKTPTYVQQKKKKALGSYPTC